MELMKLIINTARNVTIHYVRDALMMISVKFVSMPISEILIILAKINVSKVMFKLIINV
jgi:hypothetical protein